MAEKKVTVKFTSETSGLEKGLKNAKSGIEKLGGSNLGKGITSIATGFMGVKAAVSAVTGVCKQAAAVVKDLTDAYKVQANAEIQLATACKNNPLLNSTSVVALEEFASQIQSVTTYGDEELLPFMAKLAASGRTQQEIMDVMSAATNIAASGTMSLDSAVNALNATYQGNVGTLGRQISGVKNLTAEQLKNGEAVKLVAGQYKGMAEETARATGSAQQLKNAWGDLKEHLGEGLEKAIAPFRRMLTGILSDVNSTISRVKNTIKEETALNKARSGRGELDSAGYYKLAARAKQEAQEAIMQMQAAKEALIEEWTASGEHTRADALAELGQFDLSVANRQAALRNDPTQALRNYLEWLTQAQDRGRAATDWQEKATRKEAEEQTAILTQQASDRLAQIGQGVEAVNKEKAAIEAEKLAGATIDSYEEATRLYNVAYSQYSTLLKGAEDVNKMVLSDTEYGNRNGTSLKGLISYYSSRMNRPETPTTRGTSTTRQEPAPTTWEDWKAEVEKALDEQEIKFKAEASAGKYNGLTPGEFASASSEGMAGAIEKALSKLFTEHPELVDQTQWTEEQAEAINDWLNTLGAHKATVKGWEDTEELRDKYLAAVDEALAEEETDKRLSEILESQLEAIKKMEDELTKSTFISAEERLKIAQDYANSEVKLQEQIAEAKRKEREEDIKNALATAEKKVSIVKNYVDKTAEVSQYLLDLTVKANEAEKASKLNALEDQYDQGLMGEEEYEEQLSQIKKEAAEQAYKTQMWEWTQSIAQIGVSTAQAVMQALSSSGNIYAGIAMAGIVGSLGAAQLGAAMASKPKAPSFAQGGIVPGNSYAGDNVTANVNSGEMILTRSQQAGLWRMLAGGERTGYSVSVNNYLGDKASVRSSRSGNQLTIDVMDKHINDAMAKGTYNVGMAGYTAGQRGARIL